jgi:magnesium chelatase family protein
MARGGVHEALDRICGTFSKHRIPDPEVDILVNLAPADLIKDGTWLDLPIATIMMQAAGLLPDLPQDIEGDYVLLGELGLHGEVRRVPGALSIAYVSSPGQKLIVPTGNEKETALVLAKPGHEDCGVYPISSFDELIDFFNKRKKLSNALSHPIQFDKHISKSPDFGRIHGQEKAKRAAVIAAAGGHNLLLVGPPGEGKSFLASAIPGILPRLNDAEKVELTRIYSSCGELEKDGTAVTRRPMRTVHHTASKPAVIGGGTGLARPGEITLSHLGVLFLDELAEFNRGTLESLRQPMESGTIHIGRSQGTVSYPCSFTLVAAMNPCPCGYFGTNRCQCSDKNVRSYQSKLSGPILDRIDLQVELQSLTSEERFKPAEENVSRRLQQEVQNARDRQNRRFSGKEIPYNAAIPGGYVQEYCNFSTDAFDYFQRRVDAASITTRSMDRLAKVSRTIADLDQHDTVEVGHVKESATYVIDGAVTGPFWT